MLRLSLTTLTLCACAAAALAVPAKQGLLNYPQPDGTTVSISLYGDEHSHRYETADGYQLLPGAGGALEYARLDGSRLVSTGIVATDVARRPASVKQMLANLPVEQMRAVAIDAAEQRMLKAPAKVSTGLINNYPTTGSPKAMVLLVEFEDVKFSTPDANKAFTDLLTKPGYDHAGATGSALDYFKDQSNGIFTPDFQVFGPITVPHGESYYGYSTATAYDAQAWKMVQDACIKLHEDRPDLDWSEFDNDGDGYVDNIFIFYAGYGENEGAPDWTIWPHSANLVTFYNIELTFNGVTVANYACTNELQGTSGTTRAGIGTFCHEYSHVLGLPDYYPTNGSGAFTPGDYEIMDHGSYNNSGNTPPNYSAVSRYSVGWLNPRVISGSEDVSLPSIESNEALMIHTDLEREYYILENRQRSGWDSYIPGHGMLVWHVDFDRSTWINNKVNNDSRHQCIDLIEADNVPTAETRSADPFPGSSNVRRYTADSTPAFISWTGYDPGLPITDIHEADGVITFTVGEGGAVIPAVKALDATDVTPVSFTANWEPGQGVYRYEVDVCMAPAVVPFMTLQVSSANQVEITGLTPATDYSYVVRAKSDDRTSPSSNRVTVTTLPPTFEQLAVNPLPAENVASDAFTARWSELEGAADYRLTVVEKIPVDPAYQSVDFTRNEAGDRMPEGWTSSSNTTGSLKGYYGQAAPSLRLTNAGDRITTPTFVDKDINSISFWYRGNSTADDAELLIEVLVDGTWSPVTRINPLSRSEGVTVTVGPDADIVMPQGAKCVRLTFGKQTTGSLYIDDIVMGYGATYRSEAVNGYADAPQGLVTSAEVLGLRPSTTYYYTVRAVDAAGLSTVPSSEIKVTTLAQSAIESVDAAGNPFTLTAGAGFIAVKAAAGTRVRIYDLAGRLEATAIVPLSGSVNIPVACGFHAVEPFGRIVMVP